MLHNNDVILAGKGVLVVDDSREITSLLGDVLRGAGATVSVANSGRDAMLLLAAGKFDAVLVDLMMPDTDGWCVLEMLQRQGDAALRHALVVTARHYDAQVAQRVALLGVSCIFKPFSLDDLVEKVRIAVQGGRCAQAA